MRRPKGMKRGFGLILLAAAMTAGCATSTMTAAVVTKAGTGVSARPASPSAPAPSSTAGQGTRQRAEAAAAALLAYFVPPPDARRLAGPPDLPEGWEQHPQLRGPADSRHRVPPLEAARRVTGTQNDQFGYGTVDRAGRRGFGRECVHWPQGSASR